MIDSTNFEAKLRDRIYLPFVSLHTKRHFLTLHKRLWADSWCLRLQRRSHDLRCTSSYYPRATVRSTVTCAGQTCLGQQYALSSRSTGTCSLTASSSWCTIDSGQEHPWYVRGLMSEQPVVTSSKSSSQQASASSGQMKSRRSAAASSRVGMIQYTSSRLVVLPRVFTCREVHDLSERASTRLPLLRTYAPLPMQTARPPGCRTTSPYRYVRLLHVSSVGITRCSRSARH